MGAGAFFTGTGVQLDKVLKDQTYGIKTVSTIDFVGYSKEYGCYVYGDVAVKDGAVIAVNSEGIMAEYSPTDGSLLGSTEFKSPLSQTPVVANNILYILADDGQITAWR